MSMPPSVLECDVPEKRTKAAQRAGELLRRGGVAVFPTETVYGLAAAVTQLKAVERVYKIKNRAPAKPFAIHVAEPAEVAKYVDLDSQRAVAKLVERTMPGPITLLVTVADDVIDRRIAELDLPAEAKGLIYHRGVVGLRCPAHAAASEMLSAVDAPVVATSANLSGDPPPHTAAAARQAIGDRVDIILDGGRTRYDAASTVVSVRGDDVTIVRAGMFDEPYLRNLLMRSVLFVCSGNTCRSPMAEAIARHELADRLGTAPHTLGDRNWQVRSAGAFAGPGAPATGDAVRAVGALGVGMGDHRSTPLSVDMIRNAEVVYCMTEAHRVAVLSLAPDAGGKVHRLDPSGDIADPIGGGPQVYDRCARQIQQHVRRRLDEIIA